MVKEKKKDVNVTGIALGLTFGIINLICLLLVFMFRDFSLKYLFGSFMHGINITQISITPILSGITLLGFVVTIGGGYLIGVIFAVIYNKFAK